MPACAREVVTTSSPPPRTQTALALAQKQVRIIAGRSASQVAVEGAAGGVGERNRARGATVHMQHPGDPLARWEGEWQLDIRQQEIGQLTTADAGLQEEREDGQVAGVVPGNCEQALALNRCEYAWSLRLSWRQHQLFGGGGGEIPFLFQEPEEDA